MVPAARRVFWSVCVPGVCVCVWRGSDLAAPRLSQEIDGEALLLLTRDDLCSLLKLRLGTAAKVHNCIVRLRKHFNYRGVSAGASA